MNQITIDSYLNLAKRTGKERNSDRRRIAGGIVFSTWVASVVDRSLYLSPSGKTTVQIQRRRSPIPGLRLAYPLLVAFVVAFVGAALVLWLPVGLPVLIILYSLQLLMLVIGVYALVVLVGALLQLRFAFWLRRFRPKKARASLAEAARPFWLVGSLASTDGSATVSTTVAMINSVVPSGELIVTKARDENLLRAYSRYLSPGTTDKTRFSLTGTAPLLRSSHGGTNHSAAESRTRIDR
ncbi:MAG: hypothetical protein ABI130_09400 [Leifsonia sp.]